MKFLILITLLFGAWQIHCQTETQDPFIQCMEEQFDSQYPECFDDWSDDCSLHNDEAYAYCNENFGMQMDEPIEYTEDNGEEFVTEFLDALAEGEKMLEDKETMKSVAKESFNQLKEEVNSPDFEQQVDGSWERIAGSEDLDNYLNDTFYEEEEEMDNFYNGMEEEIQQDAIEYNETVFNDEQQFEDWFENETEQAKNQWVDEANETLLEDEDKFNKWKVTAKEQLEQDWTEGANEEWVIGELEQTKVQAKEKFEEEKAEIEEQVKGMWEEQGQAMVDEAKMKYSDNEAIVETFIENVLSKLRTEHEGDEEWTERINEVEQNKEALKQQVNDLIAKDLAVESAMEEEKIDEMVNGAFEKINPKELLDGPKAEKAEKKMKKWFKKALKKSEKANKMGLKQANEVMEKLKTKWLDEADATFIEDKEKFDGWYNQAMEKIQDDAEIEEKINESKEKLNAKWEEELVKLQEKSQEEGAPKMTKEELVAKVREEVNGIDETMIDETIDSLYDEMMAEEEEFEGEMPQMPDMPDMPDMPADMSEMDFPDMQMPEMPEMPEVPEPPAKKHMIKKLLKGKK